MDVGEFAALGESGMMSSFRYWLWVGVAGIVYAAVSVASAWVLTQALRGSP